VLIFMILLVMISITLLSLLSRTDTTCYPIEVSPTISSTSVYPQDGSTLPMGIVDASYTDTWELVEGVRKYTQINPRLML